MFGRATIRLGIGPHSSYISNNISKHFAIASINHKERRQSILRIRLLSLQHNVSCMSNDRITTLTIREFAGL